MGFHEDIMIIEWILILYFYLWTGSMGLTGSFCLDHFPDESDPKQSAVGGNLSRDRIFLHLCSHHVSHEFRLSCINHSRYLL